MLIRDKLARLTSSELAALRDAVPVLLKYQNLLEPIVAVKLDTLNADLTAEHEDRQRLSHRVFANRRLPVASCAVGDV
jgi:hypothetical protein